MMQPASCVFCQVGGFKGKDEMTCTVSLEALGKAAPVVPCRVVWMGIQAFQGCWGLDFAICHECVGLDGLKGAFQMVSWGWKSGLHLASIQVISFALKTSICRVTCGPQLSSSLLALRLGEILSPSLGHRNCQSCLITL